MRHASLIPVLILTGCASQSAQQIGLNQYMITAKGTQAYAKATETCDKQERKWIALPAPAGAAADQFRFECINSYEIVPGPQDTFRIRVFTPDMPVKHVTVPASQDKPADTQWVLDEERADKDAAQRATDYCGKINRTMKISDKKFEMGPGLEIVFRCVQ